MAWLSMLTKAAEPNPDRAAYIFLDEHGEESTRFTWLDLHRAVSERAQALAGLQGPVFLIFETGPAFLVTFLACLEVGLVAVPSPPLDNARLLESGAGLMRAMDHAGARLVLSHGQALQDLQEVWSELGDNKWVIDSQEIDQALLSETIAAATGPVTDSATPMSVLPKDAACMLYTSGSTAQPKGVVLTHDNLRYNGETCAMRWRMGPDNVAVAWMPHHHSFGLVFNVLVPVCAGTTYVVLSTTAFLQNPGLWLRTIAKYRASHSAGATFAYRYCVERIPATASAEWDLSCWQTGLIAAEPVTRGIYEDFYQRFGSQGLRRDFMCVLYGLSETGPVTSMSVAREPEFFQLPDQPANTAVARVGRSFPGTTIRIVDPEDGHTMPQGRMGEVWVQGPSVMPTYWGLPVATSFHEESISGTRWFCTGDLGFLDERGGLYVTGRLKEVLIYRGKNYYPQDIEWAACDQAACGQAACGQAEKASTSWLHDVAAFDSGPVGEPCPTILAEVTDCVEGEAMVRARELRRRVNRLLGLGLRRVVLAKPGLIARTRSGKKKRTACVFALTEDAQGILLDVRFDRSDAASTIVQGQDLRSGIFALVEAMTEETIGLDGDTRLGDLDLDSLQWLALAEKIQSQLSVTCHPSVFFKVETLDELVQTLAESGTP